MPTRAGSGLGLGGAAKAVSEHVGSIARLEIQLALSELRRKAAALGLGVGLLVGAAIFGLFMLGFLFATIAVVLSIFLDSWAAMLITTALLGAIAGLLAFLGVKALAKGTPPVPQQAIDEAKLTTEALKNGG